MLRNRDAHVGNEIGKVAHRSSVCTVTVYRKPLSTGQLEAGVLELLEEPEVLELLVDGVELGVLLGAVAGVLDELESEFPEPARESVR